jgi:lysophospholipase L1-like esterase
MPRKSKAVGIGIVIALCALAVRPSLLYYNTSRLAKISAQFPREYTVGSNKADRLLTYVALGDSTSVGTGARALQESLPYMLAAKIASEGYRVRVINLAVIGAKIGDVRRDQLSQLSTLHPDIITLNVGSNDATHFTDFINYDNDLSLVLDTLTKNPSTVVIVANTPDLACVPALQPGFNEIAAWRARRQNTILRTMVEGSNIQLIDLYANGKLVGPVNYASDDFHPSPRGYAKWAQLYQPVVKSLKY